MLFRHGVNHLQAHVLANALGGPPVPRQETIDLLWGYTPGTRPPRLQISPAAALSQEDGELRRIEGCFPDGGKLLDARFQDAIRPLASNLGNCANRSGSMPSLVLYPGHNVLRNGSIT
jgi:hypothetical protein